MLFVLRSERAPVRIARETDEAGVERTFWLWRGGAWVVALRMPDGSTDCFHDACLIVDLLVDVHPSGNVVVVRVCPQPLPMTIPAPAGESTISVSSVMPIAASFEFEGADAEHDRGELDSSQRATGRSAR